MFKIDLHENEKLIGIHRQTEFLLAKTVLLIFLLIYLPFGFLVKYELLEKYARLVLFWTILVALYGGYKYLLWLLNNYIITNQRILRVKYVNLLNKQVIEVPLEKIANISFHSRGLLSLTNVGNVEIHIAGIHEPLELINLRHPEKIKDLIWQIANKNKSAGTILKVKQL